MNVQARCLDGNESEESFCGSLTFVVKMSRLSAGRDGNFSESLRPVVRVTDESVGDVAVMCESNTSAKPLEECGYCSVGNDDECRIKTSLIAGEFTDRILTRIIGKGDFA